MGLTLIQALAKKAREYRALQRLRQLWTSQVCREASGVRRIPPLSVQRHNKALNPYRAPRDRITDSAQNWSSALRCARQADHGYLPLSTASAGSKSSKPWPLRIILLVTVDQPNPGVVWVFLPEVFSVMRYWYSQYP